MTRSKKNKKKRSKESAASVAGENSELKKLESLLEEAESFVDSFSYEEAESKLKEALKIDPNHCKCLEILSSIYIEKFQWQEAQDLLKKCIEISPDTGYSKYFSIAQLYEGLESVTYYEKGIEVLLKELENVENIEPSQEQNKKTLQKNLSDAYCSLAELFMSDCCFEENAEEKCSNFIELAVKSDPSNPEAYQCLASYQVIKEQIEEAKESMKKSLSLWFPSLEIEDDVEEHPQNSPESPIPVYDSRIKTSKLLIEVEMYPEASRVLEHLLKEDDEVVEVWYLLGWLNYIREGEEEEEFKKNSQFYLRKAVEVSAKLGGEEDECIEHANELLRELDALYPDDDDKEDGVEDDYSTNSESEEEMEL